MIGPELETAIARARAASRVTLESLADRERADRRAELLQLVLGLPGAVRDAKARELMGRVASPELKSAAVAWRWGDGNLLLIGPTGVGKTSAIGFLLKRIFAAAVDDAQQFALARRVHWEECRELSCAAREYRLGGGTPPEIVTCKGASLLVLNDLGAGDDRETLERVLDVRNAAPRPTITTTGLTRPELVAAFGEALTRRLVECGGRTGQVVEVSK